jgi:hypothetical protein
MPIMKWLTNRSKVGSYFVVILCLIACLLDKGAQRRFVQLLDNTAQYLKSRLGLVSIHSLRLPGCVFDAEVTEGGVQNCSIFSHRATARNLESAVPEKCGLF